MLQLLLLIVWTVSGSCFPRIAHYLPTSNVAEPSEIDLDIKDIETSTKTSNFASAFDVYRNGKFSNGLSLAMFSLNAPTAMAGQALFETFKSYWGSGVYADNIAQAVVNKTGEFVGISDVARGELLVKTFQAQHVRMWVVHQLELAVRNIDTSRVDLAWAFFAGSLEGTNGTASSGKSLYNLAQKRCDQFLTCGPDSKAVSNKRMLGYFSELQAKLRVGDASFGSTIITKIVKETTIPLIQGLLRYLHRGNSNLHWNGTTTGFAKERAEGYAFLVAILPQINKCDRGAANLLKKNLAVNANPYLSDGVTVVVSVIQSTYKCLGISCTEIGASVEDDDAVIYPACTDVPLPTAYARIAEYSPESDVTQHSRIDLDVELIDSFADTGNFAKALEVYSNGKFSSKSTSYRKLQVFSLDAPSLMTGQTYYEMYRKYWKNDTYADKFVQDAANGVGDFAGLGNIARGEGLTKGVQYQVIWMYVIRELEDAIDDCKSANLTRNDLGVKAVDEAWAFYAGSLEGSEGGSSGYLGYNLAAKRCAQFGTCDPADGKSILNKELVSLFAQMQVLLRLGQCTKAALVIPKIVSYMTIPLIQGALRYVYRGKTNEFWTGTTTEFQKERAEGWAFVAALLPQVDKCNPSVASLLKTNLVANSGNYLASGRDVVVSSLQSVYSCMGISCAQVGKMTEGAQTIFPQCSSAASFAQGLKFASLFVLLAAFMTLI